jgi:hypothetical protein
MCVSFLLSVSSGALFGSPSLSNAEMADNSRQPCGIYSYDSQ